MNDASRLLVESLNAQWDSDLVILCGTDDIVALIDQAERWLKVIATLRALGKLCLHRACGAAQNHLDASISLHPSREAYSTLG